MVKNLLASAGDTGSIPRSGRSPGEGNGNPLQYYCLENPWTEESGGLQSAAAAKSLQSCPTLCDPIDRSPPGSPVPGILQARTLECVAISFSNGMKGKSESEVAQSCPTLRDPMDCSPPGYSLWGRKRVELDLAAEQLPPHPLGHPSPT